jgi:hypothetical protein
VHIQAGNTSREYRQGIQAGTTHTGKTGREYTYRQGEYTYRQGIHIQAGNTSRGCTYRQGIQAGNTGREYRLGVHIQGIQAGSTHTGRENTHTGKEYTYRQGIHIQAGNPHTGRGVHIQAGSTHTRREYTYM